MALRKATAPPTPTPMTRPAPSPEAFALCRAFGHSWRHRQPQRDVNSTLIIQVSQCPECTTVRTRYVTNRGLVPKPPKYEHPDGYSTHGDDRKSLQQWRLVIVANLFDPDEAIETLRPPRRRAAS